MSGKKKKASSKRKTKVVLPPPRMRVETKQREEKKEIPRRETFHSCSRKQGCTGLKQGIVNYYNCGNRKLCGKKNRAKKLEDEVKKLKKLLKKL